MSFPSFIAVGVKAIKFKMFCLVGINIQQRCLALPLPRLFQLHLERLDVRGELMRPREQNSARDLDEEAELHF